MPKPKCGNLSEHVSGIVSLLWSWNYTAIASRIRPCLPAIRPLISPLTTTDVRDGRAATAAGTVCHAQR